MCTCILLCIGNTCSLQLHRKTVTHLLFGKHNFRRIQKQIKKTMGESAMFHVPLAVACLYTGRRPVGNPSSHVLWLQFECVSCWNTKTLQKKKPSCFGILTKKDFSVTSHVAVPTEAKRFPFLDYQLFTHQVSKTAEQN